MRPAHRPRRPPLGDPRLLGPRLKAWWRADALGLANGAAVASWADSIAGVTLAQATGSKQPLYKTTDFGGRPGVLFDGSDDCLELAGIGSLPSGVAGAEIWCVVDQQENPATSVVRTIFAYGGTAAGTVRTLRRDLNGRASATDLTSTVPSGPLFGRSIAACRQPDGNVLIRVTSPAGERITSAATNVGTTRARMGANTAATAANFWLALISDVLVTDPLTAEQALFLMAWGARRAA